jgi:hypothetical protein
MFSIVFNGDIADIVNNASNLYQDVIYKLENSILEISGSIDIDIYSSTDVSSNTSSNTSTTDNLSSTSTSLEKTIINITILVKKGVLSKDIKTTIINIDKNVYNYNLAIITKGNTSIYKYIKQTYLTLVQKNDDDSTLYKASDCLLINVDRSGFTKYYLDTEVIYNVKDNNDINKFLELENVNDINNNNINEFRNDPIKLLELCNYKPLYLNLMDNSYNLNLTDTDELINVSRSEIQNCVGDIQLQQSGILSNIGYIGYMMSWLNPFSYYGSESNVTSNVTSQSIQNLITSTELESSYLESSQININIKHDPIYFIKNTNITKVHNNKIKILKPTLLDIPTHIESIKTDENNKITFKGRINDHYINISFNEFMLNKNVEITLNK